MKKIIALATTLIMALTLAACGGNEAPSGNNGGGNGNTPSSTPPVNGSNPDTSQGGNEPVNPGQTAAWDTGDIELRLNKEIYNPSETIIASVSGITQEMSELSPCLVVCEAGTANDIIDANIGGFYFLEESEVYLAGPDSCGYYEIRLYLRSLLQAEDDTYKLLGTFTVAENTASDIQLAVSRGPEGRWIAFRLTVPGLEEALAELVGGYEHEDMFHITVECGDRDFYYHFSLNKSQGEIYNSGREYDVLKIEGDTLLVITCESGGYQGWYDFDALGDFTVSIGEWGINANFRYEDVITTFEEIAPGVAPLSEFVHDPSGISLNAKDNDDGTMSFTYSDASMKPMYIYPWSWVDIGSSASLVLTWVVSGDRDLSGDKRAIITRFGLERGIGHGGLWGNTTKWEEMTVDMGREVVAVGPGFGGKTVTDLELTFDENGMTATWTQEFLPGYSVDDIAAFGIDWRYQIRTPNEHWFLREDSGVWLNPADILE